MLTEIDLDPSFQEISDGDDGWTGANASTSAKEGTVKNGIEARLAT